jgi:hypothetical protein
LPFPTISQSDFIGSLWSQPAGQFSHFKFTGELENVPGEHGMHDTDPVLLV